MSSSRNGSQEFRRRPHANSDVVDAPEFGSNEFLMDEEFPGMSNPSIHGSSTDLMDLEREMYQLRSNDDVSSDQDEKGLHERKSSILSNLNTLGTSKPGTAVSNKAKPRPVAKNIVDNPVVPSSNGGGNEAATMGESSPLVSN